LTTPSGGAVALFTTSSELATETDVEGRVGVRVWRWLHAEVIGAIGFARLVTHIGGDLESTDDVELSESIRQLTLGGALLAELNGLGGSRVVPFVTAGGAYLQPLHGGRPLVDAGHTFHAGGGVHFVFRTGTGWTGRQTALGLRTDVRADVRDGGIVFDTDSHTALSAGALLFYRF
jgi:hypothetical protein